jgi:hypothetical protein
MCVCVFILSAIIIDDESPHGQRQNKVQYNNK